jgi:hypothetical protein
MLLAFSIHELNDSGIVAAYRQNSGKIHELNQMLRFFDWRAIPTIVNRVACDNARTVTYARGLVR